MSPASTGMRSDGSTTCPRALIRGVAAYERTAPGAANARFTIDSHLQANGAFIEMVYRLADSARDHEITSLRVQHTASDSEWAAVQAPGFPVLASEDTTGGMTLDISILR